MTLEVAYEASETTRSESYWQTPNAEVREDQEGGSRKCGLHKTRQGIGINFRLYELQTKSEEEAVIGRCDL